MNLEPPHTLSSIYALPPGARAELIDGSMRMMAPPSPLHQRLVFELSYAIGRYIKESGSGCRVNIAPFGVFLEDDDQNYVEPDVFVVCDPSRISERGCEGAPDFVIEVLSPASERVDLGIKMFKYRSAGVKEYWAVNPMRRIVSVYVFDDVPECSLHSFDEPVSPRRAEGLVIRVAELLL